MWITELLEMIPGVTLDGNPRVKILGIAYDSRQVKPGDLFVALKGARTDGSLYIKEALTRGAAAVAVEHDQSPADGTPVLRVPDARRFLAEAARVVFQDPAAHMQLAAITGTNGKTTTSFLVDAIFHAAGLRSCVVGTIGMHIGGRQFPSAHTTPEASDLTAFLRQADQEGCTHGCLEISSHALVLRRVYGMRFTVGVFSNLTPEHLDFHQDMEAYYQAKRMLFVPEGGNEIQTAVINLDDSYGQRLAHEACARVRGYGFHPDADIRVLESRTGMNGTYLSLAIPGGEMTIDSPLVGRPNIYNIMAAAGAALSMGIAPRWVAEGIGSLQGVPGRLEPVRAGQDFSVLVDYAHTPDALEKLLETSRPLTAGRLITVFGCGGDRDRKKRPLMGEIAVRLSDVVVATSDNPRSEDPRLILAEIEPGLAQGPASYHLQPDRREAIRTALRLARRGDSVVIAGKGHEDYQIIGDRVFPFDDRAVARELIHQLLTAQGDGDCGELHQQSDRTRS
jgi:UDP-N-acetylmuramoyl-L-alanyl-D-glutamate--2,6-diaminopimelate ligase